MGPSNPHTVEGYTYIIHCKGKFKFNTEDTNVSWKYATIENPFPKESEGSLDVNKLKQFGMTKKRLNDPMFFNNLLNPILDTDPTTGGGRQIIILMLPDIQM